MSKNVYAMTLSYSKMYENKYNLTPDVFATLICDAITQIIHEWYPGTSVYH